MPGDFDWQGRGVTSPSSKLCETSQTSLTQSLPCWPELFRFSLNIWSARAGRAGRLPGGRERERGRDINLVDNSPAVLLVLRSGGVMGGWWGVQTTHFRLETRDHCRHQTVPDCTTVLHPVHNITLSVTTRPPHPQHNKYQQEIFLLHYFFSFIKSIKGGRKARYCLF